MRVYNTVSGIIVAEQDKYYLIPNKSWEEFINNDDVFEHTRSQLPSLTTMKDLDLLRPPIGEGQELWACGVTYLRSKIGREEESKTAGASDFYSRVYEAERPEVFFKATPHRVVAHGEQVNIRRDSEWNVPEPELTLVVSTSGKIVGYTIGNDMSSRSIEGENPLYLPQAKTYDGCAALGPCVLLTDKPIDPATTIGLSITRKDEKVFEGSVLVSQIKRKLEDLVSFVFRESSFPNGCLIMTGTGIVPPNNFTLLPGDMVRIDIEGIGSLENRVGYK